jgi:hypothetical protein
MFFEHQLIHDTSQQRNRSAKYHSINHQRASVFLFECVIVLKATKEAFHHCVLKIRGAVKGRNPYAHFQPCSEMTRPPFNFFTQGNEPRGYSTDGLLLCLRNRILMEINAASQIKASVRWRVNTGLKNDFRLVPSLLVR